MSQEGRGVASRKGKVVFVSGALAGETVWAQCTTVRRDYDEADMVELVADTMPSPQRVQPPCPVYASCGGCSLQHWALAAQQHHKQANLASMLQTIAPAVALDPPIRSRPDGFRHRLRLRVARSADRSYVLGLRQRRSHDTAGLRHCLVANSAVNALLPALPGILLRAPDLPGLREVEVDADSNGQLGLCFYFAAHPGEKTLAALRPVVLDGPVIAFRVRLATQRKSRNGEPHGASGSGISTPWRELSADGELCLRLDEPAVCAGRPKQALRLYYLPGDFTQTHSEANAALVSRALAWLQPCPDETAIDLFSGIGNFSLPLACRTKSVLALEGDRALALRVESNAQRNGIANLRARALDLMTDPVALPGADIAVLDPPRAGAKTLCIALARSQVKRLVYVSCHPATLLRDARELHRAGLCLTKAAAVDMFPHTGHTEAIALFERN